MTWSQRGAQLINRYAPLVLCCWVVAAGVGNVLVPQLETVVAEHSRSFMPAEAESSIAVRRSAELFGEAATNNLNYVVLERDQPLQPQDRAYYDALVSALRADTVHVKSVTDLWADPVTEAVAQSEDGRAANVMIRLAGMLGTTEASDSVGAVRATVARLAAPDGLHVHVTGPGSTIVDEFAEIDRQLLGITAATVALILLLLLVVYRSVVAAAIPLISVGLAMAVARPIVAALGQAGLIEVSLFSVALIAAMMLGAGTDYAIFLIGRYHERRRCGVDPAVALSDAYRGVAPVIAGSGLTVAAALACLSVAEVSVFRSAGIPCAIGILVAMLASLTLAPALIGLAARRGLLEPRRSVIARRWRRIGVAVARWPGPIFAVSAGLVVILALPVAGLRMGWNEPAATPPHAESNGGYAAMDRHFPVNRLLPDVVTIEAGHDMRNPAGLIAVERITRQVMAIPGVRMVQSASRPAGRIPDEATLSHQVGVMGEQFDDGIDAMTDGLRRVADLDATLAQMASAVTQLGRGLQSGADGLGEVSSAADDMRSGMQGLQSNMSSVSGYLDPLRRFVDATPGCPTNPVCSVVVRLVQPVDDAMRSSAELTDGTTKLTDGSGTATAALAGLPATVRSMTASLSQARSATRDVADMVNSIGPQVRALTDYLDELDTQFRGSAAGGFYLPERALTDPRFQGALRNLMSADGRATYLLVYGDGQEWGVDGAARARQLDTAITEATKEGTLTPTGVELAGVGPATRDLQEFVRGDIVLLVGATLALIFLIVAVMLRSPVAGLAVVGTVVVSYASALGVSVLVWQHLLGHELHWAVAPISFIALVAVGADYNLLLTMRIREEARAGIRTGIIRAFAGTGGVVTTAGMVFGITMFALVGGSVLSVAQIGFTVGAGLLVDTLIVRTYVVPSLVALLGRWFWWPLRQSTLSHIGKG
ncbi:MULTISPECIES: RND family transporter [unclassified Mycobacterium]|uniref:MMPL/RND family transporter n=1 Tax=unclassified Mycobacterium TaxID=2642494 RepID=UPI0029C60C89|nr:MULTISPECIES: RND family transporter [unclassified Mycobacterium]